MIIMEISNLKPYIQRYDSEAKDYKEFDDMVANFRNKTFLTKSELLRIAKWKLRRVWFPKHRKEIESNPDSIIEKTTQRAIKEADDKKRIEILTALNGIGIPVASSVLTVLYPKEYAVFDINGWYALYDEEKKSFSLEDFIRYTQDVRGICKNQDLTAREVDKGIFVLGRDKRNNRF